MMRKYADLVATVGKWTSDDGTVHKRQMRVGVVMRDDVSGRMSVRLELVPVSPDWHGWLSVVTCVETSHKEQEKSCGGSE